MKRLQHLKPLPFNLPSSNGKPSRRKSPKKKDFSKDAVAKREWRRENLNNDPYSVKPDTIEGKEAIEIGNRLVEQWTPWAIEYANAFVPSNTHIPKEDFHGAALWGMTEASRIYHPSQGKFSNLATWHMRKQIQRLLARSGRVMCRPRNWRFSLQKLMVELEAMAHDGLVPNFEEACNRMGLRESQRGDLRDMYTVRTREVIPVQYASLTEDRLSPLANLIDREEFHQLREALKKLPGIYVCVLIDTFNGNTMPVLEAKYGMSAPTLLRYKRRAVEWLKYHMGQGPKPTFKLVVPKKFQAQEHPVETGTMVPHSEGED
jgi:DNA-directed RNA polymerase specialized sigma subunit